MTYNIIISDRAAIMLESHIAFLQQKSDIAAKNLRRKIISDIRSLETTPARYPFFNEQYIPANRYHKMVIENRYLVLYQIKDGTVFVDWVIDGRQDYQWLFRRFN